MISVIIPVLNEASTVGPSLRRLRETCGAAEIVVVDGGSDDGTPAIAGRYATVTDAPRGRAAQMNRGAQLAQGDTLLFLHVDALLDCAWSAAVLAAVDSGAVAGTFVQRIDASGVAYRVIERAANLRARRLSLFYGDAGVFVTRDAFERVGGFPQVEIGEEFGFSRAVRALGATVVVDSTVLVSPRRWERRGIARVTLTNWLIALLLHARVPPPRVARLYDVVR
ncbi:glycosyltransferase family 2 protein [Candidatus Poribacteria bacterium]|nr:glycosyltransferase family 2 protein [Candidatus Poribacteria bacterium]